MISIFGLWRSTREVFKLSLFTQRKTLTFGWGCIKFLEIKRKLENQSGRKSSKHREIESSQLLFTEPGIQGKDSVESCCGTAATERVDAGFGPNEVLETDRVQHQ